MTSNCPEVYRSLVGENIKAAFLDKEGHVVLAFKSGGGVVFSSVDGGAPSYWSLGPADLNSLIAARKLAIEKQLADLRDLPGLDL